MQAHPDSAAALWLGADTPPTAKASHGVSTLDLSNPKPRGPYVLRGVKPGVVGGYLALVPEELRSSFGYPVLCGQGGINIVSRSSAGPAAVGFNPENLGTTPAPATVLLEYPHLTPLATLKSKNELWNFGSLLAGMAFPYRDGRTAVMFFGTRGLGEVWYGNATMKGKTDPARHSHGMHAPPYSPTVWIYAPSELLAVKHGSKAAWGPRPYAVAELPGMYPSVEGELGGAAYDPQSGRLYISQLLVDNTAYAKARQPIIHVYQVGSAKKVSGN
jgi:hypothetical protein